MKERLIMMKLIAGLLFFTLSLKAQQKKKSKNENVDGYCEFARLGEWYLNVPLQLDVRFVQQTVSLVNQQDSTVTDLLLFYGKNNFYMRGEGMEQIANDSIMLMVNSEAKVMTVFSNNGQLMKRLQKQVMTFVPDSSLRKLADNYTLSMYDEGGVKKRIVLQSRTKVFGTSRHKETVSIIYEPGTYKPYNYERSEVSLQPIDSITYLKLIENSSNTGKLVSSKTDVGTLFFVVKEKKISCIFSNIHNDKTSPPVLLEQRIIKMGNGEYRPTDEWMEYRLNIGNR